MATGVVVWWREGRRLLTNEIYPDSSTADAAIRRHLSKSPHLAGESLRAAQGKYTAHNFDKLNVTY